MTDERTSRPVSGEIMFDPVASAPRARQAGPDVIDADFESLASPSVPPRPEAPQASPHAAGMAGAGMDILKADSSGAGRRAGPLFWVFGLALVVGAFWISGGHALVSRPADPPQRPVAETDPRAELRIVGVTSRIENSAGRQFLMVDGEVVNTGRRPAALPALDISVTDAQGVGTRYTLGTGERLLAPSGRFPFSGRLRAPAGGVGTVTVDFRQEAN